LKQEGRLPDGDKYFEADVTTIVVEEMQTGLFIQKMEMFTLLKPLQEF
jgi:hypothetical protein